MKNTVIFLAITLGCLIAQAKTLDIQSNWQVNSAQLKVTYNSMLGCDPIQVNILEHGSKLQWNDVITGRCGLYRFTSAVGILHISDSPQAKFYNGLVYLDISNEFPNYGEFGSVLLPDSSELPMDCRADTQSTIVCNYYDWDKYYDGTISSPIPIKMGSNKNITIELSFRK